MRSGSGGRIVVPLAVATGLAGLILAPGAALGGDASRSVSLAGGLDPSFGSGGIVTRRGENGWASDIGAIAVQPDGKIVGSGIHNGSGWVLARYLPSGSPDPSFGDGGYVETKLKGGDWATAGPIALQPDGKLVVAGRRDLGDGQRPVSEFMLARYNPNGSLDVSFGTDGITNTAIPQPLPIIQQAYPSAVVVLPTGGILVAGTATSEAQVTDQYGRLNVIEREYFALARYKPDGSLDPTFGDGGIAQTRFDGNLELGGIAVRPNGKIVATGSASTRGMALVQYTPGGSLDPGFGKDGKVAVSAALKNGGGPPTLQDGKIVVSGFPRVARFLTNGRLDTTFGKHGYATVPAGGPILAQKDGKILVAINRGGGVARLLPNGRPDRSFGKQGIVGLYGETEATAYVLALQGDRKILVGGTHIGPRKDHSSAWTLVRLLGGNNCVVPKLRGKTVSKAIATLRKSFCIRGPVATRLSRTIARGRVIATVPAHGKRLPGGAKVALVVSRGKP